MSNARGISQGAVHRLANFAMAILLGAVLLLVADLGNFPSAAAQVSSPTYRAAVMTDAPTAYWRLGEATGTTATDETARAPGSYLGGPSLGRPGALIDDPNTAVSLDGTNDQMTAAAAVLNLPAAVSLEVWIKPASLPSSGQTRVIDRNNQYRLYLTKRGTVNFRLWKTRGNKVIKANRATSVGNWFHLVGTFDGATMRLYVNGALTASAAYAGPLGSSTQLTRLGSAGTTSWFEGTLDEAAIYDTALSAAQVSAHFTAATTAQPPPDTTPPAVTLTEPAEGSSSADPRPTFSGAAGNDAGDDQQVTVKVYSGTTATGTPVQTLNTNRSAGSWSVAATNALADGTYSAQAEQSDAANNVGLSGTRTFSIAQPPPDTTPPAVTLTEPAQGSSSADPLPTFSGAAGNLSLIHI